MDIQSAARALGITVQSVRRAAREDRVESRGKQLNREFFIEQEESMQQALPVAAGAPSYKPERYQNAKGRYHSELDEDARVVIAYIPFLARPIRVSFEIDAQIHRAYSSDGENMTVKEMARKFGFKPDTLRGYLRARGIEHASLVWPEHEMADLSDDELLESAEAIRAAKITAELERRAVADLKRKAKVADNLEAWFKDVAVALASPLEVTVSRPAEVERTVSAEAISWIVPETDTHIDAMDGITGEGYLHQRELVRSARASLIDRALRLGPVAGWYKWVGSDLANSDNKQGTTTRGTAQFDSLPSGMRVRALVEAEVEAIQTYLCLGAPVTLIKVNGNHDWMFTDWLFEAMRMRYEDHPYVNFAEGVEGRVYQVIGKALCIFAHGHVKRLNEATLRELAMVEVPHLLAQNPTHIHVIRGDKHTRRHIDSNGGSGQDIGVAAMSPASQWSAEMGYLSARRLHALGITADGEMPFDFTATPEGV